ncbi:SDR family oxidoreductase [Pontibacter sp. E15-1]|uniref:SDR family NAD(P)-dependent oxidoreductase n=1 Tax=Pontibacter sp. E15-1 TaxID=2919918 RepID=UPI001F4F3FFC|nr:SDR family oxidoreductase [Pontibacter sp. E15-1]MCJ8164992.1 SDR family oxidoreductase [Pontibacter sp. E15-1]
MKLEGQTILVVGGTSGIGLQTARLLKENGVQVIIASRENSPEGTALGLQHVQLDVLQFDKGFSAQLPSPLHGLVYCPGSINLKPFERLTPEDFQKDYALNVLGAVQVLQAVIPSLRKANGASVVLFSSVAATLGMPYHASIAAAKAALEGLTVALAAEYAAAAIRFNAIAPSLTDTPLAQSLLNSPDKAAASAKRHPLGRVGQPQDMAAAAAFLLSEDASWMTGQILHVDGGMGSVKLF